MSSQNNGSSPKTDTSSKPPTPVMDPGIEALVQAIHATPMRAMLLFSGGASQVSLSVDAVHMFAVFLAGGVIFNC